MRSKISILLALAIVATTAIQCKKKTADDPEPEPEPSPSGINTLTDLFTLHGTPTQTFVVSATSAQTLTVNGVKIDIPANAFETTSSASVTGNVVLSVRTVLTKSEMVLSGAGGNGPNSRLVNTKGCVKATASQNSQSLRIGPVDSFFVKLPAGTNTVSPMQKYYASKVSATDSTKAWALGTDLNTLPVVTDGSTNYYQASLDSMKWLNVGNEWDSTVTKTSVNIVVNSAKYNKTNCAVFISLNGTLAVGAMYEITPGNYRISNMAVGKAVNFVGVAVINGQYYSAILPATITAGYNQALIMQPVTFSQLQAQLNALP